MKCSSYIYSRVFNSWRFDGELDEFLLIMCAEETQAPGQPTSVRTRTFVDSAVVTWSPPEDNTLVRTYMIGYGEGVPDVKWIYVNGSQRNVTILNLSQLTLVCVRARGVYLNTAHFHSAFYSQWLDFSVKIRELMSICIRNNHWNRKSPLS